MIAATGQHGTSIAGLLVVLVVVWSLAIAYYMAAGVRRLSTRRPSRRERRMSVRAARGLGAQLIADEARLKRGDFAARRPGQSA